jgi:hypothetical protein
MQGASVCLPTEASPKQTEAIRQFCLTNQTMAITSLLEQLPNLVADCNRQTEQIMERTENAMHLGLQNPRSIPVKLRPDVATNPIKAASHYP